MVFGNRLFCLSCRGVQRQAFGGIAEYLSRRNHCLLRVARGIAVLGTPSVASDQDAPAQANLRLTSGPLDMSKLLKSTDKSVVGLPSLCDALGEFAFQLVVLLNLLHLGGDHVPVDVHVWG